MATVSPAPITTPMPTDGNMRGPWATWLESVKDSLNNLGSQVDTDPTLAADSDLLVASQKATKSYVDNSLPGVVSYRYVATGPSRNFVASTTYYINGNYAATIGSTAKIGPLFFIAPGIIKRFKATFVNIGSNGSAETSTMKIRLNNSTDHTLSSDITNNTAMALFSNNVLSIAVVDGDYYEIKWVTPNWVTAPVNTWVRVELYIREI